MSNPKTCNDPRVIARLLRAIATGSDAKASKHDVVFNAAADLLDPPARSRLSAGNESAALAAAKNYIRLLTSNSAGERIDIYDARESAKRHFEQAIAAVHTAEPQAAGETLANKVIADPTITHLRECSFQSAARFESTLKAAIMRSSSPLPRPERN